MTAHVSPLATCDQLTDLFQRACELHAAIPFSPLTLSERRELGGHLFENGPGLVMAAAAGLSERPDLFPDVAARGDELRERQRLALRWLLLRDSLSAMAQLAADSYVKAQGDAIRDTMAAVRYVKDHPRLYTLSPSDAALRTALLVPAFFIVHHYYGKLERRKAQARRRASAAPAALAMPTTPAESPARLAASARARLAARADRRQTFDRECEAFLERTREAGCAGTADLGARADRGRLSLRPPPSPKDLVAALSQRDRAEVLRLLQGAGADLLHSAGP